MSVCCGIPAPALAEQRRVAAIDQADEGCRQVSDARIARRADEHHGTSASRALSRSATATTRGTPRTAPTRARPPDSRTAAQAQRQVGDDRRRRGRAPAERSANLSRSQSVKSEAEGDRDRRLEDHRAGDVAEREAVLAVADPEEAVRLLGQLGRERREDQREDERLDAERTRRRGSAPRRRGARRRRSRRGRRRTGATIGPVGGSSPGRAARPMEERGDGVLLLDVAAAAQGAPDVDRVGEEEEDRRGIWSASGTPSPSAAPSAKKTRKKTRSRSSVSAWRVELDPLLAALAVDRARRRRRAPSRSSRAGTARR